MTTTSPTEDRIRKFDPEAYRFIYEALHFAQKKLDRVDLEEAHITGQELSHGARELATKRFGLMAKTVFRQWGIRNTADFGRLVYELIERGEMRKTDRDQLSDFYDVFDFDEAFSRNYTIDVSQPD